MFQKGERYRNKHCLDVDIVITSIIEETATQLFLSVKYYNHRYGVFQPDYLSDDKVSISKDRYKDWEKIK